MAARLLSFTVVVLLALACGCHDKKAREDTASLDELNRAMESVMMRNGNRFPPDTNEVARFMTLWGKSMPVPPDGKKLVLDPGKRKYVLADQ